MPTLESTPDQSPFKKTKHATEVTPLLKCRGIRPRPLFFVIHMSPLKPNQTISKFFLKMDSFLSGVSKSIKKRKLSASIFDASEVALEGVVAYKERMMECDQAISNSGSLTPPHLKSTQETTTRSTHSDEFRLGAVSPVKDQATPTRQRRINPKSVTSSGTISPRRSSKKLKAKLSAFAHNLRSAYSSSIQKSSAGVMLDTAMNQSFWEIVDFEPEAGSPSNSQKPIS